MRQLKIIISAFHCAPGRGSEPGVGWNTATLLARRHKVWVVTNARHRREIETELRESPVENLRVIYHRLPRWLPAGTRNMYHYLWQASAFLVFWRMHRAVRFDLAHHVTLVRYWSPSMLCLLPVPLIWGPVGGGEMVPLSYRRHLPWRSRIKEIIRGLILNLVRRDPLLRLTATRSCLALGNTPETAEKLRLLGCRNVQVMGESGLDEPALAPPREPAAGSRRTRFASMTRLVYWKGVDLGLEAFALMEEKNSEYWIFGVGAEEVYLRRLCRRLGILERVHFRGDASREEWLRSLRECDVLVHPCLCNSGGMISLEAMAAGVPVICLDAGGIKSQVLPGTGFRVPIRSKAEMVTKISELMARLAADPELCLRLGASARKRAEECFTWVRRIQFIESLYEAAHEVRDEAVQGEPSSLRPERLPADPALFPGQR